jgi:hypothetical protein
MPIFEITRESIRKITETSFNASGIKERSDLQRLLRHQIEVISPETLVVSEEFGEWEDSSRRIDLLGIDHDANLVVIELKRTEDGGHMELQAIRYAAMVSAITFEKVVDIYATYLKRIGKEIDARISILEFLGWEGPDEDRFAQDVRIVLASAKFSKELTTAVMWLNDRSLDIRCVRMQPYEDNGRLLIDVQQVIPLPEAAEYQVQIREKERKGRLEREAKQWNEVAFLEALKERQGGEEADVAQTILDWAKMLSLRIWWGRGVKNGSFYPTLDWKGKGNSVIAVWTHGQVAVQFGELKKRPPFDDEAKRKELRDRLNRIPGVDIPAEAINLYPPILLSSLTNKVSLEQFLAVLDWFVQEVKAT